MKNMPSFVEALCFVEAVRVGSSFFVSMLVSANLGVPTLVESNIVAGLYTHWWQIIVLSLVGGSFAVFMLVHGYFAVLTFAQRSFLSWVMTFFGSSSSQWPCLVLCSGQ